MSNKGIGMFYVAALALCLWGCGGQDDLTEWSAYSGKGETSESTQVAHPPDASKYARYDLSFEGWLFRSSHILQQNARFTGSFYLAKEVRHGERDIRDFTFALELGKGTLDRFQPFTVRSKEDSGSYSDGEFGRENERVELILEAIPLLEKGIEHTIVEDLKNRSYPILQLQVYCSRSTTERFVEDPGFHSCNLGCVLSGFWNGSAYKHAPLHHLVAKDGEGCGPVELTRRGSVKSK